MLVRKVLLSAVHTASFQMKCTTVRLVFHVPVMPGQFNQEVLQVHVPVTLLSGTGHLSVLLHLKSVDVSHLRVPFAFILYCLYCICNGRRKDECLSLSWPVGKYREFHNVL